MCIDINTSDLIAIGSAFFAGVAAWYARRTVQAAKHQNEISIHNERLRVYNGVITFGSRLAAKGPTINESDVWSFNEWVLLSEFYFNKTIYQRLDTAFRQSLDMLAKNDEWALAKEEGNSNTKDISTQRPAIHRTLRDECFSIADAMKENLRLAKASNNCIASIIHSAKGYL